MTSIVGRLLEIQRYEGVAGLFHGIKRFFAWRLQYPIFDIIKYKYIKYRNLRQNNELYLIKLKAGQKMYISLQDCGLSKDLFLYGIREPESTNIYLKELSKGMHIVDVGSNLGYYVILASKVIGENGKIIAIEPDPRSYNILTKNIKLNNITNIIELYNVAIGDKNGEAILQTSNEFNVSRIKKGNDNTSQRNYRLIKVKTYTLDTLIKKPVDFIRMDVEGYEYFVLKGASELIKKSPKLKLFIEVHPKLINELGGNIHEMLETLIENNFIVKYISLWNPSFKNFLKLYNGYPVPFERVLKVNKKLSEIFLSDNQYKDILLGRKGNYRVFLSKI